MARHEGRRVNPAPGPGAGGHPAAGTAAIPTAAPPTEPATEPATVAAVVPVWAPALTADAVLALANEVSALYARAEVARALAAHAASDAEHATQAARTAHWDAQVNERWPALVEAIRAALPDAAPIERFMPVRALGNGHVELHAHDTSARPLVVLLSGAQALALGAHLTAYGAISLDRIGQKLDAGLPALKEAPPFTTAAPTTFAPAGPADPPATPQPNRSTSMTPEELFTLAAEFAQATGNADRFHALGSTATNDNDRAAHGATVARWTKLASSRREELRAARRETLRGTVRAVPDDELPVATTQRGRIEVRATTTDGARTVRVRYTPAQALETGAALIACAALMDDRIGGTLTRTLAALPSHLDTEQATTEPTDEQPAGEDPTGAKSTGRGRGIGDA